MRYISLDQLYIPEEWDEHAKELLDKLDKMTCKEDRSKALGEDTDFQIWSLLAPLLRGISHDKCFYTEAKLGNAGEVDHFRPKLRVEKCDLEKGKTHEGYWHLAFLIKNFRLCKDTANKKRRNHSDGKIYGKGNRFPLINPASRAYNKNHKWEDEEILLLDPTNENDVKLLRFNHRGEPISINSDPNSLEFKRVKTSIQCYNLIETDISNRRGHLCLEANAWAVRIIDLENKKKKGEPYNKRELIEKKAWLHEMVQPYAEFSSAVRCVLLQYRASPSIKKILGLS